MQAFEELKGCLALAPVLRYYDPSLLTKIKTDASDRVVAGVMSQQLNEEWHLVVYYSKTMAVPKVNYEIHNKELLAIIKALEEWRAELEGLQRSNRFSIYTDYKALEYFMTTKKLNS
jgi:hypothetical protein